MFRIGIGPSSSHTMGPMVAAAGFVHELRHGDWPRPTGTVPARVEVRLLGSLAFTGHGHATDRAVHLGLLGFEPATIDMDEAETALEALNRSAALPDGIAYDPVTGCVFDYETPAGGHPNTLVFTAFDTRDQPVLRRTVYSIGGGFIVDENDYGRDVPETDERTIPFDTAVQMLEQAARSNMTIAQMAAQNTGLNGTEVEQRLDATLDAMNACIDQGLKGEGTLPGGLSVRRRAASLHAQLRDEASSNTPSPTHANDWLSLYAIAVNEENAAGGRVVTAPTNGAAGVVPAVMRYARDFMSGTTREQLRNYLLTAGAIGAIVKRNASISGAEVGCQGEVGSASAMAAAGLVALRGGTAEQVEHAAEIALEHHLGMTCDPVAGLVQVPCIERNAFGAIKAFAAATLAMRTDTHVVSLDACVETMRQTGRDMDERYKETSQGGLAVNVVAC